MVSEGFTKRLLHVSAAIACLALAAVAVRVYLFIDAKDKQTAPILAKVDAGVDEVVGFVKDQRAIAQDNRRSIEAAVQVGAVFNGTGRLINSQVLPRLMKDLDRLDGLLAALTQTSVNLDYRVSGDGGFIAESTRLITSIRLLTEDDLKAAIAELALAGKNLRIVSESPELHSLPAEVAALAKSLNRSAGSVEIVTAEAAKATGHLEGVTGNLEKISDDVQKRAHTLLNPPPAPWHKRYILTPLKEVGGLVYLTVRILNSAN